ncbi:MAG TPA: DUF1415 domain-containing protein [Chitinophagaceae bacterium]|jgi:hypothetical protein|nr:DUF1415 domain-containing protein [Chitinophagaceae bacterium]
MSPEQIIDQTKKWIVDVVIGCNLCPFAANVVKQRAIFYKVETSVDQNKCLDSFVHEMDRLDNDDTIETSFLIFANTFEKLNDYLELLSRAEKLLVEKGNEGIYQVASFHPLYLFAGSDENDAANYTNRSIYPMLHLLREQSIDKALEHYKSPENIPERNIHFTREKGLIYMKMLRDTL